MRCNFINTTLYRSVILISSSFSSYALAQSGPVDCSALPATNTITGFIPDKVTLIWLLADGDCVYNSSATNGAIYITNSDTNPVTVANYPTPSKIYLISSHGNGVGIQINSTAAGVFNFYDADIYTNYDGPLNPGIYVNPGSVTSLGTVNIDATGPGRRSYGVAADSVNNGTNGGASNTGTANISLNIANIKTSGVASYGIYASNAGTIRANGKVNIDTSQGAGDNTIGVFAQGIDKNNTPTITLNRDVNIITGGNNSFGVAASAGGTVNIDSSNILINTTLSGDNTDGIHATGYTYAYDANPPAKIVIGTKFVGQSNINFTGADNTLTINSSGQNSLGIYAESGSVITNTAGTTIINNTGMLSGKLGILASGDDGNTKSATPSQINLGKVTLVTQGTDSSGVRADNGGVVTINGAITIDASHANGDNQYGIHATGLGSDGNLASTINIKDNLTIVTDGDNSHGIVAENSGIINIDGQSSVITNGDNSHGISFGGGTSYSSKININPNVSNSITTNGVNSHGLAFINDTNCFPGNGIKELLNNYTITATATGSDSINVESDACSTELDIANSSIISNLGNSVSVNNSSKRKIVVTKSDITAVSPSSYAISATTSSNVFFELNNAILNGAINQDSSSKVNLTVDATSTWKTTSSSTLQDFTNSGHVISISNNLGVKSNNVKAVGATAVNKINISGNYSGIAGSAVSLNTVLSDNSSATDLLKIVGSSSGTTTLYIHNLGGLGDVTTGNGIKVIATSDGGATFNLAGETVRGGNYLYSLNKVGNDWYLQSLFSPAPVAKSIPSLTTLTTLLLIGVLSTLALLGLRRNKY